MHFTKTDIENLNKIKRLNIINSVTGVKPANLIGTQSKDGQPNLAIISSVIHLGSNPGLIGFILRPTGEVPRHSYENIKETGAYTINHIHRSFIEQAHYTSAKFDRDISEFEKCNLTKDFLAEFPAPFVKESRLKMAMSLQDEIPIPLNGTVMIIGTIEHIFLPEDALSDEGYIDLAKIGGVGISGLNSYYGLEYLDTFPYARIEELPVFNKET